MIKSLSEAEMTEVYRQRMKRDFPPNELKPLTRILAQKRKHIALPRLFQTRSADRLCRAATGRAAALSAAGLFRDI